MLGRLKIFYEVFRVFKVFKVIKIIRGLYIFLWLRFYCFGDEFGGK